MTRSGSWSPGSGLRPGYAYPLLAGAVLAVGLLGNAALAGRATASTEGSGEGTAAAGVEPLAGFARPGLPLPAEPLRFATIQAAVRAHGEVLERGGLAGTRAASPACHQRQEERPSWNGHDFCAAFDVAARRGAGRDPYFAFQAESRAQAYAPLQFTAAERLARIDAAVRNIAADRIDPAGVR